MLHRRLATKYSVKDKENLASHNIWSGGEYNKNSQSDIHLSNATVIISDEHSTNGEYSYKVTPSSETGYFNVYYDVLNNITGKTAILTLDYSSESSTTHINIIQFNSHNAELSRVHLQPPSTDEFNPITMTASNLNQDCVILCIRVSFSTIIFLDNISLKIQ